MPSYLLEYAIIFIGICHHIYWNMPSYLLEYAIIFIGICHHIYWNMLSYLLEYNYNHIIGICYLIYWNMSSYLFIGICHHIYLLLNRNRDKNYIQIITSVKFLRGMLNKRKTSELFNISEFCFIISQYSYGLNFLPVDLKHYLYSYAYLKN